MSTPDWTAIERGIYERHEKYGWPCDEPEKPKEVIDESKQHPLAKLYNQMQSNGDGDPLIALVCEKRKPNS